MGRKVTRIFLRTLGILILVLFVLTGILYFAVQSPSFQTWAGQKATSYLSEELKSEVYVGRVELEFFTKVNLKGVMIRDKHKDTILHGDVMVNLRNFDLRHQKITLKTIALHNITAKLIKYNGENDFNYQYLVDYFESGNKDTTSGQGWDIK
ncbi:MAG: hypothetical protein JNL60_07975, partial [Bacteroidia bacterium]|nr:hypothetical protein [Bacteroidia bacterium]